MFDDRTYDYTKEHKEIEHTPEKGVFCTWCGKQLDPRRKLEDYAMFMGAVFAKSNLPCKPYENPDLPNPKGETV